METDWTHWAPPPGDLPELAPETLAAVRSLQKGEVEESTRHLFETFEPQLAGYFRRSGCKSEEAEDLTQGVFIRMLEQIDSLKDTTSFHFWLFKIASNSFRNFLRDRARDQEGFEDFADLAHKDSESSAFWVRGTFEPSPEAKLTIRETVDRRRRLLGKLLRDTRLAPRTRQSLMLRLHGESYQEIADILEIPVGTVGSHISRASATLLRDLETIDLTQLTAEDASADEVAELSSELLTFKREALEADPAYFRAGILEAGSGDNEWAEEQETLPPILYAKKKPKKKKRKAKRVKSSPAEIAAVAQQDRRRGTMRRRARRTILPAAERGLEPDLGRLDREDLTFPLLLLDEAAACCEVPDHDGKDSDEQLILKAKLACAGSLLARGRRFPIARRTGEIVQPASFRIARGHRDDVKRGVAESRRLLETYLGNG